MPRVWSRWIRRLPCSHVVGALALAALAGCAGDNDGGGVQLPETFVEPPAVSSANGVLDTRLTVESRDIMVGEQMVTVSLYNGLYIPPTFKVRPGDVMHIALANMIDMSTNLHTHGLNVSPLGNSDNIFVHVNGDESFNYDIALPDDHPQGTYYYHPHMYGSTEFQIGNGMSGGLIVEGPDYPGPDLRGIKDRTLILKDIQVMGGMVPDPPDSAAGTTRTLNGLVNPTIVIRPGETQLWRIANIGADIYYRLQLQDHVLYEIARDGNPHTEPIPRDEILLPTSSRVDVLVQGGAPGVYQFNTLAIDMGPAGDYYPQVTLATVAVEGAAESILPLPTSFPAGEDLRGQPIARRRKIVFSENMAGDQFCINNMQFDENRTDTVVHLGDIEEWTLQNCAAENHVFHIHQLDFQVTEINGAEQPFTGHQDTVNLPFTTTDAPTTGEGF